MLGKKLINAGPVSSGANTFASENFNTVLYTGNGSTQRIGGYINRGAVFNGSSSYIDNTNTSLWSGNITISVWFRTSNNSQRNPIVTIGRGSWVDGFELQVPSANTVGFSFAEGTKYGYFNSSVDLDDGNWHHYVQVSNSTTAKFYIDGVEQTGITTGSGNSRQGSGIRIGRFFQTPEQWAKGSIDQIRIFNKELSSSEVTTLYGETHASSTISTTDIFDDNSGVALYQLDGNANDTGGASGKFGSAAIFNGNGYINTGINNDVGTRSISLWFYYESSPSTTETLIGAVTTGSAGYEIRLETSVLKFQQQGQTGASTSLSNLNINAWNHVVGVINGSTSTLYLNGSSVGTGGVSSAGSHSLYIGSVNDVGSASQYYSGKIDDVRIYSDVLTSTEVGYIYNNTTASIPTDNLVAYYKLDGDARDEQQLYDGTATNVTYAYDGTATNVTYQEATKFQPDLVWIKARSIVSSHNIFDSIRGNKRIVTNATSAEVDLNPYAPYGLTSFNSNGFTIGDNYNGDYALNGDPSGTYGSSQGYVAWCFKGGGTAVSNTDGSITSSVSANQDAGFSIVEYTSTASTSTIGHGLSAAPELMILKSTTNTGDWQVYSSATGNTKKLILNSTSGASTSAVWNNTSPTSTVFTSAFNNVGDVIAYCFHSVEGYSKVGSYTGSSSDVLVETGFEPAWVMVKNITNAYSWYIIDNKRGATTSSSIGLFANNSNAEASGYGIHFQSNGFTVGSGVGTGTNAASNTYIYLAIAADPDTTTPTVENSFDVVTYTGTGSTLSIETDFKPDLIWQKSRSVANHHVLTDSVRGIHSQIFSQTTDAASTSTTRVQSFDEGGFTIGNDSRTNTSGVDYVAWCWKAGDHDDNLPQINTEGSIDSVVSVNAEAGFSIVKYTGNGTSGSTIGHGLSSTPQMMISKRTDSGDNWNVYTEATGNTGILYLNLTDAFTTVSNRFNNTSPTSTVFTVGNSPAINVSGGEYIAYCFHSVSGYQKIGSYTGGTANQVITTGFKPRFILIKGIDSATADHWVIYDTVRSPSNPMDELLLPNLNDAENVNNTNHQISSENNGFKLITTSTQTNASGGDYIYLAIK